MSRKTYMYWVLPLFTLLSCIPLYFSLLGTLAAVIISACLLLLAWGVVWMRLYMTQLARAEFSILAVFPMGFFTYLRAVPETREMLQGVMWSNFYFFAWIGAFYIAFVSFRATHQEQPPKGERDAARIMLTSMCALFCLITWVQTSVIIFPTP